MTEGAKSTPIYAWTICATDVALTWTEVKALKSKAQKWTMEAATDIYDNFPVPIQGVDSDSDSGSEFINHYFKKWCDERSITFTRGRARHSNANCFVDMKEYTNEKESFFDENDRLAELSKLGDPLEKLNKHMNWESLRGILTRALKKKAKSLGGRPPFNYVMMFKILVLQKLYNIADNKTEYLIKDWLSFQRFLRLQLCDTVP